jgi:CBS domain-containing protein
MLISEILANKGTAVTTITPEQTIFQAVVELAKHGIGALVVSPNGDTFVGILSERDVVRSMANAEEDTMSLLVSDLMTENVITCTSDATISELMELMTSRRIRHLPVEKDGKLAGLLSIGDVVSARLREVENERQEMENYISS